VVLPERTILIKKKYVRNTNLFVKLVDSTATTGSCIFQGVVLRDYFLSCHAENIEIKKICNAGNHFVVGVLCLKQSNSGIIFCVI
jgi:hypothetical protein